jgi:hypothetical protein
LNYPTYITRRNLTIGQLLFWLQSEIIDFQAEKKYTRIFIISHSIGGLLARKLAILEKLRNGNNDRVPIVVSISSPFQGVSIENVAKLGRLLGLSSPYTEILISGSTFLSDLRAEWEQIFTNVPHMCYWSAFDGVVSETSATGQCTSSLPFPEFDHKEVVKPSTIDDQRYQKPIAWVKRLVAVKQEAR